MHRFVAGAGVGWQIPPGAVVELALAELSPAKAPPAPTRVNAGFGRVFFFTCLVNSHPPFHCRSVCHYFSEDATSSL